MVGYDATRHVFTVKYLTRKHELQTLEIGYAQLTELLLAAPSIKLNLWKYDREAEVSLDVVRVAAEISDYLYSRCSQRFYTGDKVFGLEAIKAMEQDLTGNAREGHQMNETYTQAFVEHKLLMKERMTFLADQGLISSTLAHQAAQVWELGNTFLERVRLYNQSKSSAHIEAVEKLISETLTAEKEYLPHVLLQLKR